MLKYLHLAQFYFSMPSFLKVNHVVKYNTTPSIMDLEFFLMFDVNMPGFHYGDVNVLKVCGSCWPGAVGGVGGEVQDVVVECL